MSPCETFPHVFVEYGGFAKTALLASFGETGILSASFYLFTFVFYHSVFFLLLAILSISNALSNLSVSYYVLLKSFLILMRRNGKISLLIFYHFLEDLLTKLKTSVIIPVNKPVF